MSHYNTHQSQEIKSLWEFFTTLVIMTSRTTYRLSIKKKNIRVVRKEDFIILITKTEYWSTWEQPDTPTFKCAVSQYVGLQSTKWANS